MIIGKDFDEVTQKQLDKTYTNLRRLAMNMPIMISDELDTDHIASVCTWLAEALETYTTADDEDGNEYTIKQAQEKQAAAWRKIAEIAQEAITFLS